MEDKKTKDCNFEILKIQKNIFRLKVCEFVATGVLLVAVFVSLMALVKAQLSTGNSDYKEAATVLNTYTSIVLGFVAMTVSLIGVILSFHNTIQSERSNLSTTKEFSNLSHSLDKLKSLEDELKNNIKNIENNLSTLSQKVEHIKTLNDNLSNLTNAVNNTLQKIDANKGNATSGVTNIKPEIKEDPSINTDE